MCKAEKTKTHCTEALVANLKANADSQLRRLQACHGPAAERVKAQPRKRPLEDVNSKSAAPQPSKKTRVDPVWPDEVFMSNFGKAADMLQPSNTAEEPSQRAQVNSGELGEASILNPEQEGIMAKSFGVDHLNIEEAGRLVCESSSLEPTFGGSFDPLAPYLFNNPSTTYRFAELDNESTELYLNQLATDLCRDESLQACYDDSTVLN